MTTRSSSSSNVQDSNDTSTSMLVGLFDPPSSPTQTPLSPQRSNDDDPADRTVSSPGSLDHLSRLFAPPPATTVTATVAAATAAAGSDGGSDSSSITGLRPLPKPTRVDRQVTERSSNRSTSTSSSSSSSIVSSTKLTETTPLLPNRRGDDDVVEDDEIQTTIETPKASPLHRKHNQRNRQTTKTVQYDYYSTTLGPTTTTMTQNGSTNATLLSANSSNNNNNNSDKWTGAGTMPSIHETTTTPTSPLTPVGDKSNGIESSSSIPFSRIVSTLKSCIQETCQSMTISTTYIGSFMYLLYHVVFCLALGSAIMRPSAVSSSSQLPTSTSILGLMTKTAALGTIMASPIYWNRLQSEIPSLYPTADLFLAPFLAQLAADVDGVLSTEDTNNGSLSPSSSQHDQDLVFLATFGALTAITVLISSILLIAASVFKLANLGSFLPFPVICGFFAAVGVMTWSLSISIDTGGKHMGEILTSGDLQLMVLALTHHVPTICVAVLMKFAAPRNPYFVPAIIIGTIGFFYSYMAITHTTLDEMQSLGWMWSHNDLVYDSHESSTVGFAHWVPPAPFGVWRLWNKIHWNAVFAGLSNAVAVAFLYLIRCSVHGAALKKNLSNLVYKMKNDDSSHIAEETLEHDNHGGGSRSPMSPKRRPKHSKMFSEAVDIEAVIHGTTTSSASTATTTQKTSTAATKYRLVYAKPTNSITLKEISATYGWSQVVVVLTGGFPITPSVAASSTMYGLGAGGLAPQIGSVVLLLLFYLTDFQVVQYVPKPAFSSMLVLAAIDMIWTWAYKSWFKVKDKFEWTVVPAIVIAAFTLDLLSAVFLGIAFSTFIFVAAFFRSGVVKFVSNGKYLHSTIERPFRMSEWLDENGDAIQVVVLQNYLFFGNATSVYTYICSLFDQHDGNDARKRTSRHSSGCGIKYLILDLTLVSGMDTSATDVFQDIKNLCKSNKCKLFVSGNSPNTRSTLSFGGFKPDDGVRSRRQVRFFVDLDSAIGKCEDMLLDSDFDDTELYQQQQQQPQVTLRSSSGTFSHRRMLSRSEHGFRAALRHIDAEHGDHFSSQLVGLQEYTTLVDLQAGQRLYEDGDSRRLQRGLSFIEVGILKLERRKGATVTRGSLRSLGGGSDRSLDDKYGSVSGVTTDLSGIMYGDTLKEIKDKCITLDTANAIGGNPRLSDAQHTLRIARIGPGWVVGTLEAVSAMKNGGDMVAVTYCRLHHLTFDKIKEIEKKNPQLILALYRLLSYLMARRQESTIAQLATLHTIISSPGGERSPRVSSSSNGISP